MDDESVDQTLSAHACGDGFKDHAAAQSPSGVLVPIHFPLT